MRRTVGWGRPAGIGDLPEVEPTEFGQMTTAINGNPTRVRYVQVVGGWWMLPKMPHRIQFCLDPTVEQHDVLAPTCRWRFGSISFGDGRPRSPPGKPTLRWMCRAVDST
jgi:hypothetical protein